MKKVSTEMLVVSPEEYFHQAVSSAISELKVETSDQAEAYVTNLLSHFISTDNLYPKCQSEDKEEETTLALRFLNALNDEFGQIDQEQFRQLGDFSLYIAGFFHESLKGKVVDISYYINMGRTAYRMVAQSPKYSSQNELFEELGDKFDSLVDVLGQVSIEMNLRGDNKSLLKVYNMWVQTGSVRLEKQLAKAGILKPELERKKQ